MNIDMHVQVNDTKSLFDIGLQSITRKDFLQYTKNALKNNGEISWFTTEHCSFEWAEMNLNKEKFLKELPSLKCKKVHIGIFYPKTKNTEYRSFKII